MKESSLIGTSSKLLNLLCVSQSESLHANGLVHVAQETFLLVEAEPEKSLDSNDDMHLLILAREGAHMFSREDLVHCWVHRELVLSAAVYVSEFIGLDSVFRL